jgi:hypothetical protein
MTTDSMEVLAPSGASVKYRGEDIAVSPIKIGAIPAIVRSARPVIDALFDNGGVPASGSTDELSLLLTLIGDHGDGVFAAVALCIGRDEAWVREGDTAEFYELAKTILQVNRDFFIRRLAPLLGGRAAELAKLMQQASGAGQTPASS